MSPDVNICRPGYGASCALCCGSHNYALEPEEISILFRERQKQGKQEAPAPSKRFADALQCPHVAYTEGSDTAIGCLRYLEPEAHSDPFFDKTCKTFFCPASELLTKEEILFAARLCGDWYYYSLLIHEINLLKSLTREYMSPEEMSAERVRAVKLHLKESLAE